MTEKIKIAVIAADNRQRDQNYAATTPYFGTPVEALLQGFAQLPDICIHVIGCTHRPMKSPEKLAENTWFHSVYVPKVGWIRASYQGCIRAVRRKLKMIGADLVHGHGTDQECAVSAVFSRFPSLVTLNDNMGLAAEATQAKPLSSLWLAAQLEKMSLPRARGVICATRYKQGQVRSLVKQSWIVPKAVDEAFFGVNAAPDDSRTVLCVGAVSPRKNPNAFIKALDPIAPDKKIKLVFLGSTEKGDPYGAEFLELVAQRPWCEYAGIANREALRSRLKTASLLALPSLEDNCPMPVLEAMAAGVPVLAANVGGLPDLIEEGKTGLFCDPLDAASLGAGVVRVLEDRQLAGDLAARAKAVASERFHPLAIAKRHVEIYREVLGKAS